MRSRLERVLLRRILKTARNKFSLGTVYSNYGREFTVRGILKAKRSGVLMYVTDGWGGFVYSGGEWASHWGLK